MSKIVPISDRDYQGWAGAEGWGEWHGDDIEENTRPWWAELEGLRLKGFYEGRNLADHKFEAIIIGDRNGVVFYLYAEDSDDPYWDDLAYAMNRDLEPEEAYGAVKALIKNLKRGKIPSKYKIAN